MAAETSVFISYTPIAISLVALAVSAMVYFENKKHTLISQEPHLAGNETSNTGEDIYTVQNKGNGVAFIKKLEYFIDGKPTETTLNEYIDELYKNVPLIEKSITTFGVKGIFAIGETQTIARIKYDKKYSDQANEISKNNKYGIKITYACAYGKEKPWATSDELLEL